ncbi:enolase C-terminal domain-like protein [Ligilactobacillus salivarius]|nr:enolase C-terminal domain-like protein [Ligilactobacillus salivarius]
MKGRKNMVDVPKITSMEIIPIAGYDSPLLTLSGCHYPYFTRNVVILKDSTGNRGIAEIHGGDVIQAELESYKPYVIGSDICDYRKVINKLKKLQKNVDKGKGIQQLDISNLKYVVHAEAAVECAMLDLYGKFLNKPMCDLIGMGKQRDKVEFLGYLFYIADRDKFDLPYIHDENANDKWSQVRRQETLTSEGIVKQAKVLHEKYGFRCFKLKGGVLSGKEEMETIKALHEAFPESRLNIDPNGAWSLNEAIELTKKYGDLLTYVEDPCGPENGFSGREILSYYKNETHKAVATNMATVSWKQMYPTLLMKSVDIVLADPHFWGIEGSLRVADILNEWNLVWGSHSNNHFDITLALYAQTAAAAPGNITPVDTHFIWQDGQQLCDDAFEIKNGCIEIPNKPGLGININDEKLAKAHALYEKLKFHERNDTIAMQYLIKDWKFDSKKPTLCR